MKQYISSAVLAGFVGGILYASFFYSGFYFWLFLILVALFLVLYIFFIKSFDVSFLKTSSEIINRYTFLILVSLFIFSFSCGVGRYILADLNSIDPTLEQFIGQKIKGFVVVIDEPDVREQNTRLLVSFQQISQGEKTIPVFGKAILTVGMYPTFHYGDVLAIDGLLQKPKNFKSGDSREFDYISYLAKDNIRYEMYIPHTKFLSSHHGNWIKEKLFQFKNLFMEKISLVIGEPHASLLGGLLIGAKHGLSKTLSDEFRRAGIIHIVVLSGYNISIVAEFIMRVFSFLPQAVGVTGGAVSILFFALMTGASATTVRSCIMSLLVILARVTHRTYDVTRALFVAAFFMILYNPKILVFDPSFQLSFMATFGLIYVSPLVEKYFAHYISFIPDAFQLREFAVSTTTTQIFLLPLLLYMTGNLSLVALPVNLLILAFIPLTMLFGFLTGALGFIATFLSWPFGFIAYIFLSYELMVVHFFANLPFAAVTVSYFPIWLLLVMYVVYGYILLLFYRNEKLPVMVE